MMVSAVLTRNVHWTVHLLQFIFYLVFSILRIRHYQWGVLWAYQHYYNDILDSIILQTVSVLAALLSLIMLCMIACPCKGENTMGNCCGSKCVRIGALVLNVLTFVCTVWLMTRDEHLSAVNRHISEYMEDDDYYNFDRAEMKEFRKSFNNNCVGVGCETGGWALSLGLVCTIFSSLLGILTLAKIIPAIEPDATSAKPSCGSCACCGSGCIDEMEAPQVLPEIPLTFVETKKVETGEKFGGFNDNL